MRAAAAAASTQPLRARRARAHKPEQARADALRAGRGGLLVACLAALLLLARAGYWEPCSESYAVACWAAFEAPNVNSYNGPFDPTWSDLTGNANTLWVPNEYDGGLVPRMNDAPGTGWGVPFISPMVPSQTFGEYPATFAFTWSLLSPRLDTTYSVVAWLWIEDPGTTGTLFTLDGWSDDDGCRAKCVRAPRISHLALTQAPHASAAAG